MKKSEDKAGNRPSGQTAQRLADQTARRSPDQNVNRPPDQGAQRSADQSAGQQPPAALAAQRPPSLVVERVQTGVRMEKRLVKVLKALAELYDLSLGDLLEGIVLHAFEGRAPFTPESLARIAAIKQIYGLDLDAGASHRLIEREGAR